MVKKINKLETVHKYTKENELKPPGNNTLRQKPQESVHVDLVWVPTFISVCAIKAVNVECEVQPTTAAYGRASLGTKPGL